MKTTIIARPNGRYIHLRGHWSRFSVTRYCTRLGILSYRAAVYRRACEDSRSPVTTLDSWETP